MRCTHSHARTPVFYHGRYVAGVFGVGFHLYYGWTKTVRKMAGVDKAWWKPFERLGIALVFPLCIGFALCPVYIFALHHRFS